MSTWVPKSEESVPAARCTLCVALPRTASGATAPGRAAARRASRRRGACMAE